MDNQTKSGIDFLASVISMGFESLNQTLTAQGENLTSELRLTNNKLNLIAKKLERLEK